MLKYDAKDQPEATSQTRSTEMAEEHLAPQPPSITPVTPLYPSISTERIMQAVEQQRRVSQQLEDLRLQQKQRTQVLRTRGLRVLAVLWMMTGVLAIAFVVLLLARPDLLERLIDALSGVFAVIFVLEEELKRGLSLIPSSSWLLSGAALLVVLMMGLWIRLMRCPQET